MQSSSRPFCWRCARASEAFTGNSRALIIDLILQVLQLVMAQMRMRHRSRGRKGPVQSSSRQFC